MPLVGMKFSTSANGAKNSFKKYGDSLPLGQYLRTVPYSVSESRAYGRCLMKKKKVTGSPETIPIDGQA